MCKDPDDVISSKDHSHTSANKNNDEENVKAMGILKGCTQMKQIRVAFDVINQMRKEHIKIKKEIYDEVLKCCIACADVSKASQIIKQMNKQNIFPDSDLIDKFLELYNSRNEMDISN